jgi:hypothetical protein
MTTAVPELPSPRVPTRVNRTAPGLTAGTSGSAHPMPLTLIPTAEVPNPSEPVTPAVPEAPIAPADPDPGTPAAPEQPADVPGPDEPATPVVPEPSPDAS